jgi:hypothetical protein
MFTFLGRLLRSGANRLVRASGFPQDVRRLLDDEFRRLRDETAGTSQAVQVLLSLRYQELARREAPLPDPAAVEFRCFSQNGEDGLLLYVFALVGTTNKRAVEICAGDGYECNTANLIIHHGWEALLFDGDDKAVRRGNEFYARCHDTLVIRPTLVSAWVTAENVNDLVAGRGFAGDIDLLSLDMDGVDYWVWKALTAVRPRVVLVEFNPTWGPERSVSVPYRPDFRMDFSRQPYYHGASLAAFVNLGREKGYRLAGLQRLGFNAVFLRRDVGTQFFPELAAAECFRRNQWLRHWSPAYVPSPAERPEWGEAVEV